MIVESMNDSEFALEVIRDYFDEMRDYSERALVMKGKIKKRHASNYISKRGNQWFIVYRSEYGGQYSLHVKRLQPKEWFSWYSLILEPSGITLFGFNKHVAERISERHTRVNGGVCLGSVYGSRMSINIGGQYLQVDLRKTNTFISDEDLFDDQKMVTDESIARAINRLGKNYLSDHDQMDS